MDLEVMDATMIKELERYRFSPARRIFVVGEMLERAVGIEEGKLADRMIVQLEMDREILRRELKGRGDNYFSEWMGSRERGRGEEEHLSFVLLVMEIQRIRNQEERERLLKPVKQQLRRLREYSARARRESGEIVAVESGVQGGGKVLWAEGAE